MNSSVSDLALDSQKLLGLSSIIEARTETSNSNSLVVRLSKKLSKKLPRFHPLRKKKSFKLVHCSKTTGHLVPTKPSESSSSSSSSSPFTKLSNNIKKLRKPKQKQGFKLVKFRKTTGRLNTTFNNN
ncbi:hypothetical protein CONCODRAFT_19180 [Conidiobolus coronatus NRRL 28638]|uniref:Uncharacterized protein n=1 Tax=Conidiobolus coronatus (strain ATCC 28846 / CBS 209.66 / NRRL 28638) TaxID=796925 RepID=A0A137NZQ7_CONC2|nr:hypothetical protein CONCODRAFT_19180 [Conidiobolus coronatus NRRL 28638]|eukprot:KXN68151.1 hypothetical protein CONCODRAFT_19180 [Conidiobolus coronatus NRRL 28638]